MGTYRLDTLGSLAIYFDEARDLSARWPGTRLVVYHVHRPGRTALHLAFDEAPRDVVDGCPATVAGIFQDGREIDS